MGGPQILKQVQEGLMTSRDKRLPYARFFLLLQPGQIKTLKNLGVTIGRNKKAGTLNLTEFTFEIVTV